MKELIIMKKRYYAYVKEDVVDYFEEKLREREDKIKILEVTPFTSEKGEVIVYFEVEAEEGVINPKWEL